VLSKAIEKLASNEEEKEKKIALIDNQNAMVIDQREALADQRKRDKMTWQRGMLEGILSSSILPLSPAKKTRLETSYKSMVDELLKDMGCD